MSLKYCVYLIILILPRVGHAYSGTRMVTNFSDDNDQYTLRTILQDACDDDGDDEIVFSDTRYSRIQIKLNDPLVIPQDCRGSVKLRGSDEVDTLLDGVNLSEGGAEVGDSCILNIYSDGHQVSGFSFVRNALGAGVCVFGRGNVIEENRFGTDETGAKSSNRYAVVVSDVFADTHAGMDGSGNTVAKNTIMFNTSHGIWLRAANATLSGNTIQANGGCPDEDLLPSHTIGCVESSEEGGAGIYVAYGVASATIGGADALADANTIQFNRSGGIVLKESAETSEIKITHNTISKNYGSGLGIDLNEDGFSANDYADDDAGANGLLNYASHFQAFPLDDVATTFWAWGAVAGYGGAVAGYGSSVEIYGVSEEDTDRGIYHGGGDYFIADAVAEFHGFILEPDEANLVAGEVVTVLNFDLVNNTSEYSYNAPIGVDTDWDAIPNEFELSAERESSSAGLADTDGDDLADAVEDINRNGVCDEGETCSFMADTDGDGISDYHETKMDGAYNAGLDTDPLLADTDGDGMIDGQEDKNGNGVWEIYLGETNPLMQDTDGDGWDDASDNCPSVYNSGQQDIYCLDPEDGE